MRDAPGPSERGSNGLDDGRFRDLVRAALVCAAAFAILTPILFRLPVLYDTDSYCHLAIAQAYALPGSLHGLPWVRFSLLAEGFGDKELLFHLLLLPFSTLTDPTDGGRYALALLVAALSAVVAYLASRSVGRWGWVVPLLVGLASAELLWRLVRLRPELLSLLLLLLAMAAAGRGAYRWLGVISAVYALSYTAFHTLPGLCALLFLYQGLVRRRWHWLLLAYPVAGTGMGLLLHPQFPYNLGIWWVQNVEFFLHKNVLDVGTEIRAQRSDEILIHSIGWWLGLVAVWRSTREAKGTSDNSFHEGSADAFGMAALVFGVLYLLMRRFVVYFIPFATLALLFEVRRRNLMVSFWTRLPGRGRIPLPAALLLCVLASLPSVVSLGETLRGPRADREREQKWRDFGAAVPPNASVAATWGSAEVYALFAPQGRYLNVLDPIFMALPHPEIYQAQRALFSGAEPDIPFSSATRLASDYLAYSVAVLPHLGQRLLGDPRVRWLYQGPDVLVQFVPGANGDFVLDWEVVPEGRDDWKPYPRAPEGMGRSLEGFVDALRVDQRPACVRFRHQRVVQDASTLRIELAPYGPTSLALDSETILTVDHDLGALLGQGIRLPLAVTPGPHQLEVVTCSPLSGAPYKGFYFLEHRNDEQ